MNTSVLSPPPMRLWLAIRLPADSHSADNFLEKKLMQLCESLYQFTPHLQIYISEYTQAHGVLLEISRSLTLFGGIKLLLHAVHQHLQSLHTDFHHYRSALAHSAQAAWLRSFADEQHALIDHIDEIIKQQQPDQLRNFFRQQLQTLPINFLDDFPRAVIALKQTGFITLGDVMQQIHTSGLRSFTKRFGNEFSEYLSDMLDISQDLNQPGLFSAPVPMFHPETHFIERLDLEFPSTQLDLLEPGLALLLQKLSQYLHKRQHQCQMIEWHLISIYREREIIRVHCDTPQQQSQLLLDLSLIQLEQFAFRFAVDQVELHCPFTSSLQAQAYHLDFSQQTPSHKTTQDFALTTAKLKARLGDSAIYKVSYKDDHLPELSNDIISYQKTAWQVLPSAQQQALRPKWLFAHPQTIEQTTTGLHWKGKLQLLAGPERIHTHWWDTPTSRDYFMAQRQDGLRIWIFKDLQQQQWFVQGIFC